MKNKQIAVLFVCNIFPPFIGMGLFPILPLYAAQLGATRSMIGIYYAVVYLASLLGTMMVGWVGTRISSKRMFVSVAALGVPVLVLLGHATAFWQVVLLTALLWFCGTFTLTLTSVFTGLVADSRSRGASFSLMTLGNPLGAVFGGLVVGQLVASQGYALMFVVLGALWIILPVIGLIGLHEQHATEPASSKRYRTPSSPHLSRSFYLLLLSSLLSAIAVNISRLSTSLSMQALHFSPSAVASTAMVSGLVTIPVVLILGALSDRLGHRRVLTLSYLLAVGGAVMLSMAMHLWHFQVAATLLLIAWCTNGSVASALATTMLPVEVLGHGLPKLKAVDKVASVTAFASAGYLMDGLGEAGSYSLAAILGVIAIQFLGLLSRRRSAALPSRQRSISVPTSNELTPVVKAGQ